MRSVVSFEKIESSDHDLADRVFIAYQSILRLNEIRNSEGLPNLAAHEACLSELESIVETAKKLQALADEQKSLESNGHAS